MNSRERVQLAVEHQETDITPVDFGSCGVTGIHVSALYQSNSIHNVQAGVPTRNLLAMFEAIREFRKR